MSSPADPVPVKDRSGCAACVAWAGPGSAATAAPPSAVPSNALRGTGERFSGCEVIITLQT
ncbi:hypothetical protein [Streptomyces sp. IMTB 2501]|uniref:hypothetical protein n=1 Tax=Streptomyces sp. IMTB 2501 TaxID=1776340 RepID=UPI00211642A4|nr:hypothetical protein [Streptomyces sp. IMTB 2501]